MCQVSALLFQIPVIEDTERVMATKDQQITQLMEMGFGNNRVVRALQATAFKVISWLNLSFELRQNCNKTKYLMLRLIYKIS